MPVSVSFRTASAMQTKEYKGQAVGDAIWGECQGRSIAFGTKLRKQRTCIAIEGYQSWLAQVVSRCDRLTENERTQSGFLSRRRVAAQTYLPVDLVSYHRSLVDVAQALSSQYLEDVVQVSFEGS